MGVIVGLLLGLVAVLNAPSTARAADRCAVLGTHAGGARGLVVARPGHSVLDGLQLRSQLRSSGCATTYWIAPGGGRVRDLVVTGAGFRGTVRSHETRVDGLVSNAQLRNGHLRGGGDADVPALRHRLQRLHDVQSKQRVTLICILGVAALLLPRAALVGGPAAISAALLLSALGSTSVVWFGLLTIALALVLRVRSLWLFFPAYLAVLVLSPETQSLALLGPHPWNGGRFYGMTNELETLVLAPALLLGLRLAPVVLLTVGWSRAGADGGGLLTFLAGYAVLLPRRRTSMLLAYGAGIVALGVLLVALDAATGGSSHVTSHVLHGHLELRHRWAASWHGVAGSPGRAIQSILSLLALGWVAWQRPRRPVVDAFLVAILVSLVANDTPQDVLLWGAITGVALRRSV